MMFNRHFFYLSILLFVFFTSCSHETNETTNITVAAAASMKDVLTEIRQQYEEDHPNVTLTFTFASSGTLQKQIEQGAPIDIFVSADPIMFQQLVRQGMISSPSRPLARNELILITSKQNSKRIRSLSDLTHPSIHSVAIGIPETVPAGAYAKQWLESVGLWENIRKKLVLAKDVRQVLTYVETGNADAGIVYQTDAISSQHIHVAAKADPSLNEKIAYYAGIINTSQNKKQAEQFAKYLHSRQAQSVLKRHGFIIDFH
jgi:molybdate transport system substrate-binding protein